MLCIECGHLNDSLAEICEKCGVTLPDRETHPPRLERNFYDLEKACNKVRSLEMSSGEFRDFLCRLENQFNKTLDDLNKMEIPAEYRQEMSEEMSTGIGGIKLYLEALHEMHSYLDTRDSLYLDRGLGMARDANNRINDALRLNYENYRAIQETAEEFLATQSSV